MSVTGRALLCRFCGSDFTELYLGKGGGERGWGGRLISFWHRQLCPTNGLLKLRLPAKVKTVLGFGDARIIRKENIGVEPMLPTKVKTPQTCLRESHSGAV